MVSSSISEESNDKLEETGSCQPPDIAATEIPSSLQADRSAEERDPNAINVTSDLPHSRVTMSDLAEPKSPIAIPKANYAIDWDKFDENTNPFQSRSKLGSSPPHDSGIKASPPDGEFNPFKPRRKLAQSPPPGGGIVEHLANNNNNDLESPVTDSDATKVNAELGDTNADIDKSAAAAAKSNVEHVK